MLRIWQREPSCRAVKQKEKWGAGGWEVLGMEVLRDLATRVPEPNREARCAGKEKKKPRGL